MQKKISFCKKKYKKVLTIQNRTTIIYLNVNVYYEFT